ncbi:MAG: hypothetical protein PHH14_01185 [Candidatus Margulisbacteria bacterium]|nr:hypothetical protein [Candidatus Margulisiibacteriota bacterium]
MNNKLLGSLLLALALAVLAGFLVKHWLYWEIVDVLVIIICGAAGIYLIRKTR